MAGPNSARPCCAQTHAAGQGRSQRSDRRAVGGAEGSVERLRLLRGNRDSLQRDCVMPISRGGRYTVDNVVPACAACNASKCNDEVTGWMRRKRLDERAFLERYVAIRAARSLPTSPGWR